MTKEYDETYEDVGEPFEVADIDSEEDAFDIAQALEGLGHRPSLNHIAMWVRKDEAAFHDIGSDIGNELLNASLKFPGWPQDLIHAAAIVSEEAGEVVKVCNEYLHEDKQRSVQDIEKELIQTAAMCVRFLLHLRGEKP